MDLLKLFQALMKKSSLLLVVFATLLFSFAVTASASAYLHVNYAQNYARTHMYNTFCGGQCTSFPDATGWYDRISDSYVRVQVTAYRYNSGQCYRVFAVRGSDAAPYITSDGSSYGYACF